jgi:GNAT superfamily N-acetyltransferase
VRKLKVRAARPEDLNSIGSVFRSHGPAWDWRLAKKYYEAYFSEPALHAGEHVLVGISGDRVVGVIGYLHDTWEARGIFWLGWLYVHKDDQGDGYGKILLEHVVTEVKKRGGRKLYTDTSSWQLYHERAHRYYTELGLKREGILLDFYQKGEHRVIYGMDLA